MSSSETDLLGSDRLRRAIERNKAKRAHRASVRGNSRRAQAFQPSGRVRREHDVSTRIKEAPHLRQEQTTLRSRLANRSAAPSSATSIPSSASSSQPPPQGTIQNFSRPGSRLASAAPTHTAIPSPTTISPEKRTATSVFLTKLWEIVLKGMWLFCGVLIFRLIFTTGGVVDYYTKQDHFQMKDREYRSIGQENKELLQEIDKITNSPIYQKKLVRTYLEFIGHDEFLILFAREEGGKSL